MIRIQVLLMAHHHYKYNINDEVDILITRSGVDMEVFRGKKFFVTGGTGFFGIWVLTTLLRIKDLLDGELDLLVLSRSPSEFIRKYPELGFKGQIEFVQGDVKNFKLKDRAITHLIHMATTSASETYAGEDQLEKLDMLYIGTKNVLEQCAGSLESVLFTSSGVAYGTNVNERITESDFSGPDTTANGSALALGKLNAEYLVNYFSEQQGYKFSIARCFSFAGQYLPLDLHYAFGNFIHNALEFKPIVVQGDGKDQRSYLYIGDAVAWMIRMLSDPKNSIFNVGSENPISIESLAYKVAAGNGSNLKVKIMNESSEIGNFRRVTYTPSIQKIQVAYPGITEWTSIDEIISKMLDVSDKMTSD